MFPSPIVIWRRTSWQILRSSTGIRAPDHIRRTGEVACIFIWASVHGTFGDQFRHPRIWCDLNTVNYVSIRRPGKTWTLDNNTKHYPLTSLLVIYRERLTENYFFTIIIFIQLKKNTSRRRSISEWQVLKGVIKTI